MIKLYLYIIFSILYISTINAQLTNSDIQKLLNLHNTIRRSVSPAPKTPLPLLTYDYGLAAQLNTSLSTCQPISSALAQQGLAGEWQYWWTPPEWFTLDYQMQFISNQSVNFDWNTKNCKQGLTCGPWLYVVWAATTKFGCAKVVCDGMVHMSCSYQTVGGYPGVAPYTLNTPTPTPTQTQTPTPTTPKPTQTTPPPTTPPPTTPPPTTPPPTTKPPKSNGNNIDWRIGNYVTPIRDQGQCGSCWAFGSAAAMESGYLIKNGNTQVNTLDLSEQNIINCLPNGCNGGWIGEVFESFQQPGLAYEADVPYVAADGTCSYISPNGHSRFFFNGYGTVPAQNKQALINQLQNGPVAVGLWVDDNFMSYRSGIYSSAQSYTTTNHVVLVIGYNADNDYWIIKNSWNTYWGESGFMRLTASNDNCYLLGFNSYYPTF